MQHLPLPVTAADDESVVTKLAQDAIWSPYEADWKAAYQAYQAYQGNPFAITAIDFGQVIADLQYKLYDTRKNSGELGRMRRKEGLKSCPVCGSPVTGDLDHYLPRRNFPEFAIMRANLVPACRHCNSGVKGQKIHGGNPRRFIHPYFDTWAQQAIWYVKITPPFHAATFEPRPLPTLIPPRDQIVAFHLENVLGSQFHLSMANEWASLPGQIKLRDPGLTTMSVIGQIGFELRVAIHAMGTNSWKAAMLRGLQQDPAAIEHLRQAATTTAMPPLP